MRNFELETSGLIYPDSQSTRIQMMPFMLNDESTWTDDIKRYGDIVQACLDGFKIDGELYHDFSDNPCFITIDESNVKAGSSQRAPGVHTEGGYDVYDEHIYWGRGGWTTEQQALGGGIGEKVATGEPVRYGGLFVSSNLDKSTAVWDENVERPGELGDCSHLGLDIKDAYIAKAGDLLWMHDKTPHASLPILTDTHRQFIRIVGPQISHWFGGDNTKNPHLDYRDWEEVFNSKDYGELKKGEYAFTYLRRIEKENPYLITNDRSQGPKIISIGKKGYLESQKEKERLHEIQVCTWDIQQQCVWLAGYIETLYKGKRKGFLIEEVRPFLQDIKRFQRNNNGSEMRRVQIEMGLMLEKHLQGFIDSAPIDDELRSLLIGRYDAYADGDLNKGSEILHEIDARENTQVEKNYISAIGHLKSIEKHLEKRTELEAQSS